MDDLIGTTEPIFIPQEPEPKAIRPGKDYFFVQVHSAQAAFRAPIWERGKNLVVSSQVSFPKEVFGGDLRAIQRSRRVQKGIPNRLGLSPNLINLVPANFTSFSVTIDFLLDVEDRMAALGGLINSDAFVAAVSLAPGASTAARTIGGLAEKIIQTFLPNEQQRPILQFGGQFNLLPSLHEGYYAVLSTEDRNSPIPNPIPRLTVSNNELLGDGKPVRELSFVVLKVVRTEARTRDLNDGASWADKLREAENLAERIPDEQEEDAKRRIWENCRELLKEAQILLRADRNYHREEANDIYRSCYQTCYKLSGGWQEKGPGGVPSQWQPDPAPDIPDLASLQEGVGEYSRRVHEARLRLREHGMMASTDK
jgi:hypothetical protein